MAKTEGNLDAAAEAVVFANHPGFIFKSLRKLDVVRDVSESNTVDEIIARLRRWERKRARNAWDIIRQYVWLVSLAHKEPKEVLPRLDDIRLNQLQWAEELKAMIRASLIPTNRVVVEGTLEPVEVFSGSHAPVNRIILSGRS